MESKKTLIEQIPADSAEGKAVVQGLEKASSLADLGRLKNLDTVVKEAPAESIEDQKDAMWNERNNAVPEKEMTYDELVDAFQDKSGTSSKASEELISIMTGETAGDKDVSFSGGPVRFTSGPFKGEKMGPGNIRKYVEDLGGKITDEEVIGFMKEAEKMRKSKKAEKVKDSQTSEKKASAEKKADASKNSSSEKSPTGDKAAQKESVATQDIEETTQKATNNDSTAPSDVAAGTISVGDISFGNDNNQNTINIGGVTNVTNSMVGGSSPAQIEGMTPQEERKQMAEAFNVEPEAATTKEEVPVSTKADTQETAPVEKPVDTDSTTDSAIEMPDANDGVLRLEDQRTDYQKGLAEGEVDGSLTEEQAKLREGLFPHEEAEIIKKRNELRLGDQAEMIELREKHKENLSQNYQEMSKARTEYEAAYKLEVQKKESGFARKQLKRTANALFGGEYKISAETRALQEKYYALKDVRRDIRLKHLQSLTDFKKLDEGQRFSPHRKNKTTDQRLARSQKLHIQHEAEIQRDLLRIAQGKEGNSNFEKFIVWQSKVPRWAKIGVGLTVASGIGAAAAGGFSAGVVGIAGARMLRGIVAGGLTRKGVGLVEENIKSGVVNLSAEDKKSLDLVNDSAKMAQIERKELADLTKIERRAGAIKGWLGIGAAFTAAYGSNSTLDNIFSGNQELGVVPDARVESTGGILSSEQPVPVMDGMEGYKSPLDIMIGDDIQEAPTTAEKIPVKPNTYTIGKGDGGIKALFELRTQLETQYAGVDQADMPEAVQKLLAYESADVAAIDLGFYNPDGINVSGKESFVLHVKDTIGIDAEGNLVFDPAEGEPQILLNDGPGENDVITNKVVGEQGKEAFKNYTGPGNVSETNGYDLNNLPPVPAGVDPSTVTFNLDTGRYEPFVASVPTYGDLPNTTGSSIPDVDPSRITNVSGAFEAQVTPSNQEVTPSSSIPDVDPSRISNLDQSVNQTVQNSSEYVEPQPSEIQSSNVAEVSSPIDRVSESITEAWQKFKLPERTEYFFSNFNENIMNIPEEALSEYFPKDTFGEIKPVMFGTDRGYEIKSPSGKFFKIGFPAENVVNVTEGEAIAVARKGFFTPNGLKSNFTDALKFIAEEGRKPL